MNDAKIKYVIADDHTLFREGLRLVLSDDPQLQLQAEASNGKQLLELLKFEQPDVILMDLTMPEMDGITATREVRAKYPGVKVLILTMSDDQQMVLHLLEIGANGYLIKNADSKEIKLALRACVENGYYFNDYVSALMLKKIVKGNQVDPNFRKAAVLNEREVEVLKLICEGMTATEIGKTIFLSPRTVEGIRATLLEKTGAKNVAGLVMYAVKNKIVD